MGHPVVRGAHTRAWLALALALGTAAPAGAASYAVGTFAKSTAAAPATQVIPHGLGQLPKALIVWTSGPIKTTTDVWSPDINSSFGMTDGTTSLAASTAQSNNQNPSSTWKRLSSTLVSITYPGTLIAEATLSSWDATSFTLNWTTNDTHSTLIHFIAIGGNEVSAKLLSWNLPSATGAFSVTGVGFQPDLVLHTYASATTTLPTWGGEASWGLAAMDKAGHQWSVHENAVNVVSPTNDSRAHRTDSALMTVRSGAYTAQAAFQSMDADGFTLNFSNVGTGGSIFSLALKGISAQVGSFTKLTGAAPASQTVSGLGFTPGLVFLASDQQTATTTIDGNGRFGVGAMDGTHVASMAGEDLGGVSTSVVSGVDSTTAAFLKTDNSTSTVEAKAAFGGFAPGSFGLSWAPNDAVATELLYLALGTSSPSQLVFTTPARTYTAGVCGGTGQAITVQLQDRFGNPVNAGAPGQTFTATTSSSKGALYVDSGCLTPAPGGTFTIPSGAASVSLYYQDAQPGDPSISITNSASLTNPPAQVETVQGGNATGAPAGPGVHAGAALPYTVGCACQHAPPTEMATLLAALVGLRMALRRRPEQRAGAWMLQVERALPTWYGHQRRPSP